MQKRKLQVFVSSTFTDLKAERQAAVAAILKAGHIPAGMELFTAGDKSQLETIKRWIDESDVYVLILGGRYGSIEPASSVSYTELEYDYAAQQGKSLFAIVIDDVALDLKVRENGPGVMETNNGPALKQFRSKVLSNVSSFYSDEKDIRLAIHESLADMRDSNPTRGWVAAADIEDTKPLHDEIAKLRQVNQELLSKSSSVPNQPSRLTSTTGTDVDLLIEILRGTDVLLPDHLAGNGPKTNTALSLFVANKEYLVNGVTNASNASDGEIFLYSNLSPKLIVHGLMTNEKVTGVRYRRSFVNTLGMELLAEADRRKAQTRSKLMVATKVLSDDTKSRE